MTDKPFGNYCHKHGKGMYSRCQDCIDELVDLGIQADKERIAELVCENERLRKDAERFNWIALNVKTQLTPESMRGEIADHKTMYVLPRLIEWADFCGNIPFAESVDYAMSAIDAARGEE